MENASTPSLILYYRPTCPFCLRVLDIAHTLHVPLNLKNIEEQELHTELVTIGGISQVPFLVDKHTNILMYESSDIIEYLTERYGKKQ